MKLTLGSLISTIILALLSPSPTPASISDKPPTFTPQIETSEETTKILNTLLKIQYSDLSQRLRLKEIISASCIDGYTYFTPHLVPLEEAVKEIQMKLPEFSKDPLFRVLAIPRWHRLLIQGEQNSVDEALKFLETLETKAAKTSSR